MKNCFPSYCVKQYLSFLTCFFFKSLPLPLLTVRHIYEISEMTTHERRTIVTRLRSLMDFSFRNSWEICLSMRELKVRGARENCVWHAGNLKLVLLFLLRILTTLSSIPTEKHNKCIVCQKHVEKFENGAK